MFNLPPASHPASEGLDSSILAEWQRFQTFTEALRKAQAKLVAEPMAKSITLLCLRADDEIWLIRVGRRGGWKKMWNFGRPYVVGAAS